MVLRGERHRGVIFDLDGVLVDSESLKAEAHALTVASFGGSIDPLFYGTVMGGSHEFVRAAYFRAAGIDPEPEEYSRRYRDAYDRQLDCGLRPFPGVLETLAELRRRGLKLAVATSSKRWMVDRVFSSVALAPHLDAVISADDVAHHKPHPESYLLALRKLEIGPESAVVIEDSDTGLAAAARAGVAAIAFRHALNSGHDLSAAAGILETFDPPGQTAGRIEAFLATGKWE